MKPVIRFKHKSLEVLQSSERSRRIGALHLRTRAMNSLHRLGIISIGRLVQAAQVGIAAPWAAGRKTAIDIKSALDALSNSIRRDGRVDWNRYLHIRGVQPARPGTSVPRKRQVEDFAVHFSDPSLDGLMSSFRKGNLEILHPSPRARNSLQRIGISSVGALVDAARRGIKDLSAAGPGTTIEIEDALGALSQSIRNDGSVDWMTFAAERKFIILPKRIYAELSLRSFLKIFPEITKTAVECRFGPLGSFVFQHYLLQDAKNSNSLEEVARGVARTKQGVALLKDKVLTMLRGAILDDDYCGCHFRFRHIFVTPLREIADALITAEKRPLPYFQWQDMVARLWGITVAELAPVENLLFSILGYHLVHPSGSRFQPIILPKSKDTSPFTAALPATQRLLRYHFPNGLSEKQLLAKLGQSGRVGLTASEIPAIIDSVSGIKRVKGEGKFQINLDMVVRLSDQLERILRKRGGPMHLRELTAEIARVRRRPGRVLTVRNISAALSHQERFKSVSRTGYWVLREWKNVETGTIADIAAEILHRSKRSMTQAQLYPLIARRRLVGTSSLCTILRQDGRFRRVAPMTWELKIDKPCLTSP